MNQALCSLLKFDRTDGSIPRSEQFWPEVGKLQNIREDFATEFRGSRGEMFFVKLHASEIGDGYRVFSIISSLSSADSQENFHAQRLETLGMLAGGVAHDFNNVLAGILGHNSYLRTILPPSGPHVESLTAIADGAKKGSLITQQILNFSRLDTTEVKALNLGDLIKKTCLLLKGAMPPDFVIAYQEPKDLIQVLGGEGKLAQVVTNLIMNARDAVEEKGSIQVDVDVTADTEELQKIFQTRELSTSRYARLMVTDNGVGMTDEVLQRVFEPYFSTKKEKGTGLGLTTCSSIVNQFGGSIRISSRPHGGTTVTVYLPMVDQPSEAAAPQPKTGQSPVITSGSPYRGPRPAGEGQSILVVDDEYPVRNVLSLSLEHLGYRVETAASGAEGIERYTRADAGRFSLVLLDMLMPHLSGHEVFFRLKKIDPDVQVLVISGFSSEEAVKDILDNGGLGFLQKPFTIEQLSRQVHDCLHRLRTGASVKPQ